MDETATLVEMLKLRDQRIEQQDKALQVANSLLADTLKRLRELEDELCYVWSPEHNSWWGVNRMGYASNVKDAGLYTRYEAKTITKEGNKYRASDEYPYESIVPQDCAPGIKDEE